MKKSLIFYLFLIAIILIASKPNLIQLDRTVEKDFPKRISKVSGNGWIYFKDNFKPDPKNFFSNYMKEFGLSFDDEMRLIDVVQDSVFTFYRFQHYYKNIFVEGSSLTLQFRNENIELVFGTLAKKLNINISNKINPNIAFSIAKKNSGGSIFAWELPLWESKLRQELKDSSATYLPKPVLVICPGIDQEFTLAYKIDITTIEPATKDEKYYINAITGKEVRKISNVSNSTNSGIVYYYQDTKQFTTEWISGFPHGHYRLQDQTRGWITANLSTSRSNFESYVYLKDNDGYWDYSSERPAITALWAAEKCYDFFKAAPRYRNGTNNQNRELRISTKMAKFDADYWTQSYVTYDYIELGYINDTSFAAIDIIGHEYTHGVTRFTAGLLNIADECGALNESFSDIFGECIEYYVDGSCDWLVGGDFFTFRSFIDPHESHTRLGEDHGRQPITYLEGNNYWSYSEDPLVYTHRNSGVANKWFYLLVNGDPQLGVTGIGMTKSTNIAYKALTTYLYNTPYADFNIAREASINAALWYYGLCSSEYLQVMNAWAAVGVGNPAPNPCNNPVLAYIVGPGETSCGSTEYYYTSPSGGTSPYTYEWYFNGNLVSTSSGYSHYFSDYYTHSDYISLTVTDSDDETVYDGLDVLVNCGEQGLISSLVLSIYPNPASEMVTLEMNNTYDAKQSIAESNENYIYIFDNSGKSRFQKRIKNNRIDINTSQLEKGEYTIVVKQKKYSANSKLIINR